MKTLFELFLQSYFQHQELEIYDDIHQISLNAIIPRGVFSVFKRLRNRKLQESGACGALLPAGFGPALSWWSAHWCS